MTLRYIENKIELYKEIKDWWGGLEMKGYDLRFTDKIAPPYITIRSKNKDAVYIDFYPSEEIYLCPAETSEGYRVYSCLDISDYLVEHGHANQ